MATKKKRKKIDPRTAATLGAFVIAICALAAWGDRIGLPAEAVTWFRAFVAMIGAAVCAAMPKILRDEDEDGVPDWLERDESDPPPPPSSRYEALVGFFVRSCVTVAAVFGLEGCGHQLTPAQRTALAIETQECGLNERAIVSDPCGDLTPEACEARDREALAAERARCDAARQAIESSGGEP